MKKPSSVGSFARFVLDLLIFFCLVAVVPETGIASSQSETTVRKGTGRGVLEEFTYNDIPEATEPCTPEACEWWKQIRAMGNELNRNSDKKLKAKFLHQLQQGQQKAYRVPLKDRPSQVVGTFGRPSYPESVQGKVTGTAALSVEFRSDGSVGEVQIVKRLGLGIDENLIRAVRKSVFLPAIENGAFVTSWRTVTAEFHSHNSFSPRH